MLSIAKEAKKIIPIILIILLLVFVFLSFSQNWTGVLDGIKDDLVKLVANEYGHQVDISGISIVGLNRLEIQGIELNTEYYRFYTEQIQISYNIWDLLLRRTKVIESIESIEFSVLDLEWLEIIEEELVIPDFINSFTGSIVINEANFKVNYLEEPNSFRVVKGDIDFLGADELNFDLESEIPGIEIDTLFLKGQTNLIDFDLEVVFSELNLAKLPPMLEKAVEELDWKLKEGLLSGKLDLEGNLEELSAVNYQIDLQPLNLLAKNKNHEEEIKLVSGGLSINQRLLSLNDLVANVSGSQLELTGLIRDWQSKPELYLSYQGSQLDLALFDDYLAPELELSGVGEINGQLRGSFAAPIINTELNLSQGEINGSEFDNISFKLWYRDGIANLSALNAQIAGGDLAGRGTIKWQPGTDMVYSASIEASEIELAKLDLFSKLPLDLPGDLEGSLNGDLVISGQQSATGFNLFGNIKVDNGTFNKYDFDSLSGTFWVDKNNLLLSGLILEAGPSRWKATGLIDEKQNLSLDVEAEKIDLISLKEVHNYETLTGIANFQGEVTGKVTEPNFVGEVNIDDLTYLEREFGSLSGIIAYQEQKVELDDFRLEYKESSYQMAGSIELLEQPVLDLNLETSSGSINDLYSLVVDEKIVDFDGEFDGRVTIKGDIHDLVATGNLRLLRANVNEINLDDGLIDFIWDDNNLEIEQLELVSEEGKLEASGSLNLDGDLDLNLKSRDFNLAYLSDFDSRLQSLAGNLDFDGQVTGDIFNPNLSGSLNLGQVLVLEHAFDNIAGQVEYAQDRIKLKNVEVKKRQTLYNLDGALDLLNEEFLDFRLSMENGKLAEIITLLPIEAEASNLQTPHSLYGEVIIEDKFSAPRISGEILVEDFEQRGNMNLKGSYDHNLGVDLSLTATAFSLVSFNELLPIEEELIGRMNLEAEVQGKLDALSIDSNIEIWGGGIGNFKYDSLTGAVTLAEGKELKITERLEILVDDDNLITAQGHFPLNDEEEQALYLELSLVEGNLSLLSNLLDNVDSAEGASNGRLIVSGTRAEPDFEGTLDITAGSIRMDGLPAELSAINSQLNIKDQAIKVNKLSGKYGEGNFDAVGEVAIDNWNLGSLDFAITGRAIPFEHGSWVGKNNIDLDITGTATKPHIGGELVAYDTRILIPFEWPVAEEATLIEPSYDLIIRPGRNVRVYNDNIDVLVEQGTLNLVTLDHDLAMRGNLRSKIGRFNYYNNSFEVESAVATFNIYDGFMPRLDIVASTELVNVSISPSFFPGGEEDIELLSTGDTDSRRELEEVEVSLNMRGPADQMDISFQSNPELSENEIVNLLAQRGGLGSFLDENYQEALEVELWRIIQAGITFRVFSGLEGTIEDRSGLDQFRIYPSFNNNWKIRMGKYLSNELFVKYEQTINGEDKRSMGFEYEIIDRLGNLTLNGIINNEDQYELKLEMLMPFN